MNIKELKENCKSKQLEVKDLYFNLCSKIIKRDLDTNNLFANSNNLLVSTEDDYITIDDKRDPAFRWYFGVIIENYEIILGDAFEYGGSTWSIEYLDDNLDDISLINKINNHISAIEESIDYMKSNTDISSYKYYYWFEKGNIKCDDIDDIFYTVWERIS